jgi:hypothetical protein
MAETFNGLRQAAGEIPVFNTADHGAVRVVIDRHGITVAGMNRRRR